MSGTHPATYSKQLYPVLRARLAGAHRVLDPFAGEGNFVKLLPSGAEGVGVEIQPTWAAECPSTICADSRDLVAMFGRAAFDAVVSSPVYPNGCADDFEPGAAGGKPSRRHTYRACLGEPLAVGSMAGCGRGLNARHNDGHRAIAEQIVAVLRPGGRLVWNVKDVIVAGEVVPVVQWWADLWSELGLRFVDWTDVTCPGIRHGANRDARVDTEAVLLFRKPFSHWLFELAHREVGVS